MRIDRGRSWFSLLRRVAAVALLAALVLAGAHRSARAQSLAAVPAPPAAPEPPVEERARSLHFKLKIATAAALLVTGTLGGVLAYNLPNSLHQGACQTGDPLLGEYGCGSLGTVHGISAVASIALYTSTATLEFGIPHVPAPEKI